MPVLCQDGIRGSAARPAPTLFARAGAAGCVAGRRAATATEAAADDASYAVTDGEVREFLRAEAALDPDVIDRFKAARGRVETDHRQRIRDMFDRALEVSQMMGGYDVESFAETDLDLSPVLDEARTLERRGNLLEAERLYRHLSEVLYENMPSFNEWESEFKEIFDECNTGAKRCAKAGAVAARDLQLASTYTQSAGICAEYLRRLQDGGDPGKAGRIAAYGARRFPKSKEVQSLALLLCPRPGADYRASLRRMFVLTGSQEHLDELKRRSPLWAADRCELIRDLEGREDLLAAVLHGEGMVDELADTVLSARWPGALPRRYHDALATPRHGERLFAAYKKRAERAIKESKSGGDYRIVGECLRRMRSIPGQEPRLERYASCLRRRYGRRRALMERLGRMGTTAARARGRG